MLTERQQRFLTAYTAEPTIAGACRLAGIHRATVYRWKVDPAFVTALESAWKQWHRGHLSRLAIERAARAEWRREREAARLPMRRANLARALDSRRRKRGY